MRKNQPIKNLSKKLLVLTALILFFSTSCGKTKDSFQDSDFSSMPENYEADIALINLEKIPELGEGVLYREIDDLEKFVASSDLPILFSQLRMGHESAVSSTEFLEKCAEDYAGKIRVIRAKEGASDPYIKLMDREALPYFIMINKGRQYSAYEGFSEQNAGLILKDIEKLTGGKSG